MAHKRSGRRQRSPRLYREVQFHLPQPPTSSELDRLRDEPWTGVTTRIVDEFLPEDPAEPISWFVIVAVPDSVNAADAYVQATVYFANAFPSLVDVELAAQGITVSVRDPA